MVFAVRTKYMFFLILSENYEVTENNEQIKN